MAKSSCLVIVHVLFSHTVHHAQTLFRKFETESYSILANSNLCLYRSD